MERDVHEGVNVPLSCERCGREVALTHAHFFQVEWGFALPLISTKKKSNLLLCEQCTMAVLDGARPWPAPPGLREEVS